MNHMSEPSQLSAGINTSSRETGAASDGLESQETEVSQRSFYFLRVCSWVMQRKIVSSKASCDDVILTIQNRIELNDFSRLSL